MITLYAADTANSSKIFIALEELRLPYEVKPVDILAGQQFEPALTELNPNSKIPVIVDSEGPDGRPHTVFESGAILLYLADKTGLLLSKEPVARSEAIQWLMMQMSTVGPMTGQLIHFARFAPPGNEYALARYRSQVHRFLDVLERRVQRSEWLGGSNYSIVDIANFPWVRPMKLFLGDQIEVHYPHLTTWVSRIAERPAVVRADEAKAKLARFLTPPDKSDPDKVDRLLGRGAYSRT
jgi:GST-like protein